MIDPFASLGVRTDAAALLYFAIGLYPPARRLSITICKIAKNILVYFFFGASTLWSQAVQRERRRKSMKERKQNTDQNNEQNQNNNQNQNNR